MPEEVNLGHGLEQALTEGRWLMPGDKYVAIISKSMSERLNVTVGEKIWIFSKVFTVIGIFDEEFIPLDIDGRFITPYVIIMNEIRQCPPEGVIIVPYDTLVNDMKITGIMSRTSTVANGGIESIAIKFNQPGDVFQDSTHG